MSRDSQCACSVLMVRPIAFHANPLTADSNSFMKDNPGLSDEEQQAAAAREFDGLVTVLRRAGVEVIVFEDTDATGTPDSIFPNNWVSFHDDGTAVLYPMMAVNRRAERRMDIVEALSSDFHFRVTSIVDLSPHEQEDRFLEGTGSLVLDRRNRIAYACISPRTHIDVLGEFAQRLDYDIVTFDALDRAGEPVYHTNVMMAHGDGFVVICTDTIRNEEQKMAVLGMLEQHDQEVIEITIDQMESFAGNMLEVANGDGERVLAMSQRALESLTQEQVERLSGHASIVTAPINVIEDSAGGSVRCMLAEIFLPRQID